MTDLDHLEGFHSRGYLPHIDPGSVVQFVTWRLADSLPAALVEQWVEELQRLGDDAIRRKELLQQRIERYLDQGVGSALLSDVRAATVVQENLLHFDGQRYRLLAWVIMPNHVHVVVEVPAGGKLGALVHSWKSYTATAINRVLGRSGAVWFRDYFDRFVRNEEHLAAVVEYVHQNPVKAKLVKGPEQWPFSSAHGDWRRA